MGDIIEIVVDRVTCGYGRTPVVENFSATVKTGRILCLLGPNGIGKTTLFKSILRLIPLMGGHVQVDGRDVARLTRKSFAKLVAYVPQIHTVPFPFLSKDVVVMGRTAHLGAVGAPSRGDYDIAFHWMDRLGIGDLADKPYPQLSGGERQMVLIARAMAQEAAFLMMDEPTSSLDFGNQARVLGHIMTLSQDVGIIVTTHFPDHALQCDSDVVLMQQDGHYLSGPARDVVTQDNLRQTYGVDVRVVDTTAAGVDIRTCVPIITAAQR